ncbi:MAG TPA: hypothetical protein VF228_08115 [Iamia sp.]
MRPNKVVSAVVMIVLVLAAYGGRYALRKVTADVAEERIEDAVDDAYRYQPPVTTPRPTTEPVAETAPETTTPAPTTTPATTPQTTDDLPEGWPQDLALVDGLAVQSTSDVGGPSVIGNVKGDLVAVTEAVRADLAEAGFVVDDLRSTAPAAGGSVTQAAGPAGEVTVLISPVPEQAGAVLVTYRVQPAG